jgi:hypothetical protein
MASLVPLLPDPTFSAMETREITEEDPDEPHPADEEDIQVKYSSH